jgi:hypothetical protein
MIRRAIVSAVVVVGVILAGHTAGEEVSTHLPSLPVSRA